MHILWLLVGAVAAVLFLIFLYTWYRLRKAFHVHVTLDEEAIKRHKVTYSTEYFTAANTQRIACWYVPVLEPKAVVVLVHGYKTAEGGKALMLQHIEYLSRAGYSTVALDLRSVGDSPGHKVTMGVQEWQDVVAAYDYVKAKPENKQLPIGFLGISMGATTALLAASLSGKGDFVVASVPYANLKRMFLFNLAKERLPALLFWLPLDFAARIELGWRYQQFNLLRLVKCIKVPLLLFSARDDEMVFSADARLLYDKAQQPKQFWQAPCSHDIFAELPDEASQRVLDFLGQYVAQSSVENQPTIIQK